jgi:hypothetical protein
LRLGEFWPVEIWLGEIWPVEVWLGEFRFAVVRFEQSRREGFRCDAF